MSYARHQNFEGNRTLAVLIVVMLHLVLGYALVTGLAYTVVSRTVAELKAFDVEEEPPPPPEEPPPPPEPVKETPPPVVAPPPVVRTKVTPPRVIETVPSAPPPVITPTARPAPPSPPAPPPPPAVKPVPPRSAVGNLQGLFRGDDYPSDAIRRDEEGSVTVRLTVAPNGRVSDCRVTASSGSSSLDRTACRVLKSRSKFKPARDSRGNPTTDTVSQRIKWVLKG